MNKRKALDILKDIKKSIEKENVINEENKKKIKTLKEQVEAKFKNERGLLELRMAFLENEKKTLEENIKNGYFEEFIKLELIKTDIYSTTFANRQSLYRLLNTMIAEKLSIFVPFEFIQGWDIFHDDVDELSKDLGISEEECQELKDWANENLIVKKDVASMIASAKIKTDQEYIDFTLDDDQEPKVEDCDAKPYKEIKDWEFFFETDSIEKDDPTIDWGDWDSNYAHISVDADVYVICFK
jgi:hypothetical protein